MSAFTGILSLPEGIERTAALAAWVQGLYGSAEPRPILVGGAAVELYTGGAYSTGDLDFVGTVPRAVARALKEAGFERRGRHWIHEVGQVFLEFPSSSLESGEEIVRLRVEDKEVLVLEPEALVADRLAAWQVWESPQDGVSAWLISRGRSLDFDRVAAFAKAKGVAAAATRLADAVDRWRGEDPTQEDLIEWATEIPCD